MSKFEDDVARLKQRIKEAVNLELHIFYTNHGVMPTDITLQFTNISTHTDRGRIVTGARVEFNF